MFEIGGCGLFQLLPRHRQTVGCDDEALPDASRATIPSFFVYYLDAPTNHNLRDFLERFTRTSPALSMSRQPWSRPERGKVSRTSR
jgi:hypothetical protein